MKKKKAPVARKRFGQNFLHDTGIIQHIVDQADLDRCEHIVEIGPGRGALTNELLKRGMKVTAVEIDRDLARLLQERFGSNSQFKLISDDILTIDWMPLFEGSSRSSLIANLPYNISTPIFFKLTRYREALEAITIMVQKELAQRMMHTGYDQTLKEYGILSVIAHAVFRVEKLMDVAPHAFFPKPKVQSTVLRLIPLERKIDDEERYFDFVRRAFNHRRKLFLNHLKNQEPEIYQGLSDTELEYLKQLRPENLKPDQFWQLYQTGRVDEVAPG